MVLERKLVLDDNDLYCPVRATLALLGKAGFKFTVGSRSYRAVCDDPTIDGLAVDPDAPEQIALAVKDILAHPEKVSRVVASARVLMEEQYDWDVIAVQMRERVFAKVLL